MLTVHLKKEDAEFYPKFHAAAEADGALKNILTLFAADMDSVAEATLLFLNKYARGGE